MSFLLDYLPVLAFVIAYKFFGIFVATGVLVVGVVGLAVWQWIRDRKINPMMLISAAVVLVLGTITLAFRNEVFIQWKPTIASWAFALIFLASMFVGRQSMVEQMMAPLLTEAAPQNLNWRRLNLVWVVYWIAMGFVNLWLLFSFDLTTWVNWHLIVLLGLTVAFILGQGVYLARKFPESSSDAGAES